MIYLVIGNGRLAKHLIHYLNLLKLPCFNWHYRNHHYSKLTLSEYIQAILNETGTSQQSLRIILAIKDSAINQFIKDNLYNVNNLYHCSGALETEHAIRIHPLMTFSNDYYNLDFYQSIPLITCSDKDVEQLLPDLPNKIYKINREHVGLYHALCVIAGNFSQILWQTTNNELEKKLELPKDILENYLRQATENFIRSPDTCLTGPLARNDNETINKNLSALELHNKYLHTIYKNIQNLYYKHE